MPFRLAVALSLMVGSSIAFAQTSPAPPPAEGNDDLQASLIALEKQSWEAWQKRDGSFFDGFLSEDHVDVHGSGPASKGAVVAGVASPMCAVKSYAVTDFRMTRLNADTALLVYHAEQDTTCGGHAVPSPSWVSSVYVRRGGRWWNALFQVTDASRK